jgi:hypothetical protein
MQAIKAARRKETRECISATLDENAAETSLAEAGKDRRRSDMPIDFGQGEDLDIAGMFATRALSDDDKATNAVLGQQARARRKPTAGIDDDARRTGSCDAANRQLRVVRQRGSNADDDSIDKGAKTMQMSEARRPIDVMRPSGRRRDAPVKRLADLTDDDEIVDDCAAQRSEYVLPRRRKPRCLRAKRLRNRPPGLDRRIGVRRKIAAGADLRR